MRASEGWCFHEPWSAAREEKGTSRRAMPTRKVPGLFLRLCGDDFQGPLPELLGKKCHRAWGSSTGKSRPTRSRQHCLISVWTGSSLSVQLAAMNAIRQTQLLNKRELENAIPPSASWHADYRDTAYIYIGGIPLDVSEGDVVTIFSQYGNPTHINMIRDKETGKSKGFAFLKYEDQRSCDLAVDNLGGAEVLGRMLRVDHTRYKKRDDEDEETYRIDKAEAEPVNSGKRASDTDESEDERRRTKKRRPLLKEERELEELLQIKDGEEADPMRDYLIREKREEVERAKEKEKKHKHRHRSEHDGERKHRHRSHREDKDGERHRRHRSRSKDRERDSKSHRSRRDRDDSR
jgi:RNA-binding motif X-linked protein 2